MKSKYLGLGLIAVLVAAVAWWIAYPPLAPRAEAQGGEKMKPGRYQVIGAGLITAVLIDNETGKTWALTPGNMMDGPGRFGASEQEFAWTPITKFDDLDSFRRWVKQQQEKRMKNFYKEEKREEFKDKKE